MLYEEEEVDYASMPLGELQEVIGVLEDSSPRDKRKKEYQAHKDKLNELFDIYNKKANYKYYVKLK